MKKIRIRELLEIVERYGFRSTDKHWCTGKTRNEAREIVRNMLDVNTSGLQLRHKLDCPYKDCVNPNCYELKFTRKTSSFYDEEDFFAAVESVDYEDCLRLGIKKYLEKYNSDKIDLLKLNLKQLCEIMAFKSEREEI